MEVGESFITTFDKFPDPETGEPSVERTQHRMYSAVNWAHKRFSGKQFVARTVVEEGGVRVWRVE